MSDVAAIPPPSAETLAWFGIRLITPLGGRLNQHWLVASSDGEQQVLRRWASGVDDIAYELNLLDRIAALGWPVAPALGEPLESDGRIHTLFPFLPGEPPDTTDPVAEQRARGRLLAQFHADLAQLTDIGQRKPWRRGEETLRDPALDRILRDHETTHPDEVPLLRWHLDRARQRIADLAPENRPDIPVHGDFTAWNLRFHDGRLTGILDFELAHRDHRIGDFALSWRGYHDAVIHGYHEVSPLDPEEWELLTPLWWAFLIEGACRELAAGTRDDGWLRKKLLTRSPLMGPDANAYP